MLVETENDLFELILDDEKSNVYLTKEHIVIQNLSFIKNQLGQTMLVSHDLFYRRTPARDRAYENVFEEDGIVYTGRRIKATMSTRQYID